jgi:hypothetical protein
VRNQSSSRGNLTLTEFTFHVAIVSMHLSVFSAAAATVKDSSTHCGEP